MAITLVAAPSGTPSAQDNMWHIVTSNNSTAADFKFVFDIYVNGVQKIRVKQFPSPTNNRGFFDAGPIIRNEMTYAWFEPTNNSVFVSQPDMSGQIGLVYQIQVGEDVSGITTSNMASGQVSGYNWAPPLFKRRITTLSDKLNKWLTNRPMVAYSQRNYATSTGGENLFIPYYTSGTTAVLTVDTYGVNNALIDSANTSPLTVTNGFIQLNVGPPAILNGSFGGFTIDEDVKYYEVYIGSGPKFRVYLTCNPKYTSIPVHFLNRWGMFDTLRFDLASRLSMDIERKGFGQRDYLQGTTEVTYMSTANRFYEGKINYSNKANWSYKLNTNGLTDADFEWAAELFTSPQVLLEIDGYFYPATIKKNNYEYQKYENDRLKNLEVEFELNTERQTQLR